MSIVLLNYYYVCILLCKFMSHALSIMDVKPAHKGSFTQFYSSEHVQKSVDTIARAINCDADVLRAQFEDVYPRAVQTASAMAGSAKLNKTVWKTMIEKLNATPTLRECHPTDVLRDAGELYLLFGPSSSGVEQGFSIAQWGFGDYRQSALPDAEEFALRIVQDLQNHDREKIIKCARRVWFAIYGRARESTSQRIDKGVLRSTPTVEPDKSDTSVVAHTETDFIKSRRAAIAAESSNAPMMNLDADALIANAHEASHGWTAPLKKELDFQTQKLHTRKVQAVAEGVLPGDDALRAEVKSVRRRKLNDEKARQRKRRRIDLQLEGKTVDELLKEVTGKHVYVDVDISYENLLDAAFCRLSMQKVDAMHDADVFIVNTPGEVGQRVKLVTGLRGAIHISPQAFSITSSISQHGVAAKWRAIACLERVAYVSVACSSRHTNTFKLIKDTLASMPSSKLQLVTGKGWDELTALNAKFKSSPSKLIAITRANEKNEQPVLKLYYGVSVNVFHVKMRLNIDCNIYACIFSYLHISVSFTYALIHNNIPMQILEMRFVHYQKAVSNLTGELGCWW